MILLRRDLRSDELRLDTFERLVGVVVCLEHDVVSTVYRNEKPVHHVMRKAMFDRRNRMARQAPDEELEIAA